jgi:archaellum biogenesis ATPase FlaH
VKLKVKEVINDRDYDCVIVDIDKISTQIVFNKTDHVERYIGKTVELICDNGKYVIKEAPASEK